MLVAACVMCKALEPAAVAVSGRMTNCLLTGPPSSTAGGGAHKATRLVEPNGQSVLHGSEVLAAAAFSVLLTGNEERHERGCHRRLGG